MKKLFFHFKSSLACSIAYCIPVFFLFKTDSYTNAWLLYLGNFCFALLLVITNVILNNKESYLQPLSSILQPAFKIEIAGVILSCIIVLLFIFFFKDNNIIKNAPANNMGLYYMLPLSAILINLAVGSFSIFLWAITSKRGNYND